jgi:hypothetical protein
MKQPKLTASELMARVDLEVAAAPKAGQQEGANRASSAIQKEKPTLRSWQTQ